MKTCINPDAHSVTGLEDVAHGIGVARKGWCTAEDCLNAWPLERLQDHLRARRREAGGRR
jgi:DNA polymerase (family 10)